jgi:hypothetical protein
VKSGACKQREWPFPRQTQDAEQDIYDLQDWERLDGGVEVLSQEVPEDLGPEEGFESSGYLIWSCVSLDVNLEVDGGLDVQAAAVKMTRRAQWFLINLPILL